MTAPTTHAPCLDRRGFLKAGLGLNFVFPGTAPATGKPRPDARPIRSCVFVFLYGGPSHIDTFDPKPDAPAEVRGEFKPIATATPSVRISEHLPRLARLMDKAAIIRSMHHGAHLHDSGSIHMLTGRPLDGPDRELFAPLPQKFPSLGSAVSAFAGHGKGEVPFASLPFVFNNVVPTPCQGGGILGSGHDPLRIDVDPVRREYGVDVLAPREGLGSARFRDRWNLLGNLRAGRAPGTMEELHQKAIGLLGSDRIRAALDIGAETERTRERYGVGSDPRAANDPGYARQMRGQNFLLARRLVEAGVSFVTIHDYRQQGQNWDAHANCAAQHKGHLLPPFDLGMSALIEDLEARGLLDSTLVVATGEFGRTPKINANAGRDHWPECSSVFLAGGGITGGAVHGASDRLGAFPDTNPATPGDLAATIFWRFGIDPATEIRDQARQPHRLATGEPLAGLF